MIKKKVIVGTIIMLASTSNSITAMADNTIQEQAREDAKALVLGQQQIDEEQLHRRSPDYVNAFLAAFEEEAQCFAAAFQQGLADAKQRQVHKYSSAIACAGYQRGYDQGQRLMAALAPDKGAVQAPSNILPVTPPGPTGQPPLLDDQQTYPVQTPTGRQAAFINRLAGAAQQIGKEYDLFPSIIIAQAALESDWGTSTLGRAPYFNIFGVKGYFAGRTVNQPTSEYDATGKKYQISSNFRRYSSDYEALKDYAETLQAPLYNGVHRRMAKDYRAATRALVGKYATDPHYNQKLNQLIDSYQLTKYDHPDQPGTKKAQWAEKTVQPPLSTEDYIDNHSEKVVKEKHGTSPWIKCLPVVGGVGSVGIIEAIKRLLLRWLIFKI